VITIPEGATVADVVGETDILAGQDTMDRALLLTYANQMREGIFDWTNYQVHQPIVFHESADGLVIDQGHHRWLAARLAEVEIPVTIHIRRDYLPGKVPFARPWKDVAWE
jgi:hypothetical protein